MMLKRCSRKSRAGSIAHRLIMPSILYRVVRPPTSVRFRMAHRTKRAERPPNAVAATPIALRASTVVPACTERASKVLMTFAAAHIGTRGNAILPYLRAPVTFKRLLLDGGAHLCGVNVKVMSATSLTGRLPTRNGSTSCA